MAQLTWQNSETIQPNAQGRDKFLPLGGGNEIGASCYALSIEGAKFLIDAGMRLGDERAFPDYSPLYSEFGAFSEIDAFLLTHAHLDHSAAIGMLQAMAPLIPKYATTATLEISRVMLLNAARISSNSHENDDRGLIRAQTNMIESAIMESNPVKFGETFDVGGKASVTVYPAGHILGAASYLIETPNRRALVTGDFCLHNQSAIPGARLESIHDVDLLILESTYAFQPSYSASKISEQQFDLLNRVCETVMSGHYALIPAFALGRAQEIATLFSNAFTQGIMEPFPVLLDGLVCPICDIYNFHRELLLTPYPITRDHAIYSDYVRPVMGKQRTIHQLLSETGPACVIVSSGMLLNGTRSARYAEYVLPAPGNAVFLSSYVDDETPGGWLLHKDNKTVKINGHIIQKNAAISGYRLSAHADIDALCWMIEHTNPRHVILVHSDQRYSGEPIFLQYLMSIRERGISVYQAFNGISTYF